MKEQDPSKPGQGALTPESTWGSFSAHRAFIVGINAYANGIAPLRTAASDARRLAQVLANPERNDRFLVHPPLIDADASAAKLRELLASTMKASVGPKDRVIFYFAGHGIAADGEDGPAGYIVPSDATPTDPSSFIPMAEVQAALDALPCRHLLVVLDCCFSGAFRWSSQHRALGSVPKRMYAERFDRFAKDGARQVITSAAYDQKALDVLVGKATGDRGLRHYEGTEHSPFAVALFRALDGEADALRHKEREGDGVITASEIYGYIRDEIEPQSLAVNEKQRQTPSFFPLRGHDKGEFMFLHPRHRLNLPRMDESESPYKGLQSFDEKDAHLFYGRERVVQALRERAARSDARLIVITGPSGTGKSSVIKAGLLPQLRAAGLHILPVLRPGEHPVAALEKALDGAPAGAVLCIDQMEELVTRCSEAEQRQRFQQRLADALDGPGALAKLVITVRSDFEPQFIQGPLKAHWIAARFTVPPFSAAELRDVIEMPALQASMIFDPPKLVDQMIDEVVQSAGALPLLSYALRELYLAYQRRGGNDRALTQADYDALGGVAGALTKKADALYEGLGQAEQGTMRRIMLRMVSLDGALAGKRVPKRDIAVSEADQALVERVVTELVDARLVVSQTEAGVDCIEPAHDALVRAWPRLIRWLDAFGRDHLMLAARLAHAASDYQQQREGKEAHGLLWHDNPNLALLQQDLKDRSPWFNAQEQDFIQRSVAKKRRRIRIVRGVTAGVTLAVAVSAAVAWQQRNHAVQAATEAQAGELAAQAESLLGNDPDLGVLLAMESVAVHPTPLAQAVIAGAWGASPFRVVLRSAEPGAAKAELSSDGAAALTLAKQLLKDGSFDESPDAAGVLTLWDARTGAARPMTPLPGKAPFQADAPVRARFAPDGLSFVTVGADAVVRVWDTASGQQRLHLEGQATHAAFSPDGLSLLSWGGAGEARVWDLKTGELRHTLQEDGHAIAHAQWVQGEADTVATFTKDGSLWHWRVAEELISMPVGTGDLRFSTAPETHGAFVSATQRGPRGFAIYGHNLGRVLFTASEGSDGVVVSPNGDLVVTRGKSPNGKETGGYIYKVPAAPGAVKPIFFKQSAELTRAAFSPDGMVLITVDSWGGASLRNPETGEVLAELSGETGMLEDLDFSPDSRLVVTADNEGVARVWRADDGQLLRTLRGNRGHLRSARFSADGRSVITLGAWDDARIWDLDQGETSIALDFNSQPIEALEPVLSADGRWYVAVNPAKSEVAVFDLQAGGTDALGAANAKPFRVLRAGEGEFLSAHLSPDAKRLLTTHPGGSARVWELASGKPLYALGGASAPVEDAQFSRDSERILTRGGQVLAVWRSADGGRLREFRGHEAEVASAHLSADGRSVISADKDGGVLQWDVEGQGVRTLIEAPSPAAALQVSADGLTLQVSPALHQVMDVSSQDFVHEHQQMNSYLSTDGTKVLKEGADGVLRMRDLHAEKEWSVMAGRHNAPSHVRFSPDGRLLLLVNKYVGVDLVDVASGRLLRQLVPRSAVGSPIPAFSADGHSIVVALSGANTVIRWACRECQPAPKLLEEAKRRIARTLTNDERFSVGLPEVKP